MIESKWQLLAGPGPSASAEGRRKIAKLWPEGLRSTVTKIEDGVRVECVRLLARAGANVNARDTEGNTPLHETFLTDVEEELLKLGADVNARNNDGDTPIFTNVDDNALLLFIKQGADLNIRNKKGESVFDAAERQGPARQEALRKALEKSTKGDK